ncbi:hypothetical protein [Hyphomicrobium sulfonivorans]|uniref:hypothetical protein n=1 Tax=Hyphomicrobium sulfonivorans TaxID=121290 RepID=UPI0012ED535A|nr:hypothetical protein [Hyphomicrobium sulfonivorans]
MSQRGLFAPACASVRLARPQRSGARRILRAAAGVAGSFGMCLSLAACAGSTTPLPDLRRASAPSLSQQEQKAAVEALNRKGNNHASDAVREIEGHE